MGSSSSRGEQNVQYNHKKRENHSIFGEIILVQNKNSSKLYSLKTIKTESFSSQKSLQKLFILNQDHKQKCFVSIKQIDQNQGFLNPCSSQENCNILLDCIEVDLQSITQSKYFRRFQQIQLLNIITNILEGIITLQNQKLNIFPIYKKSVILNTYKDQYKGQDLSKAIFKVIPLDLVRSDLIQVASTLSLFPPQIQYHASSQAKSILITQFTPKNHIYCLGMMILELIYDQNGQNKVQQISFGDVMMSTNKEITKQKQIQVLQQSNFSLKFKQILKMMVQDKQQNRIGLTSLYDICKMMYNDFRGIIQNPQNQQMLQNIEIYSKTFNKKINKNKKRTISVIGLSHRQNKTQQFNQIKPKQKIEYKKQRTLSIDTRDTFFDMSNTQKLSIYYRSHNPSIMHSPMHRKHELSACKKNKIINSIESTRFKQSKFATRLSNNIENSKQQCKNKKHRKINFKNGASYEGEVNHNNEFNGFGTLFYTENQICYTGYWKNNQFHGFGYLFNHSLKKQKHKQTNQDFCLSYKNFDMLETQKQRLWEHYEGEFKNDQKDGFGILFFIDGSKFQGQFVNNKVSGTGSFINPDGNIINGIWKNNILIKQYD